MSQHIQASQQIDACQPSDLVTIGQHIVLDNGTEQVTGIVRSVTIVGNELFIDADLVDEEVRNA